MQHAAAAGSNGCVTHSSCCHICTERLICVRQSKCETVTALNYTPNTVCWPGSSVGIATDYGLDGPVSNPGGDEIFRTCPDRPWGPPSLL